MSYGGEVMYFECVCFRGELGFLNCDHICMCVVNKQFVLTCSMMRFLSILLSVSWCCVCGLVVVFGLSVRLSWYPMWMRWLL